MKKTKSLKLENIKNYSIKKDFSYNDKNKIDYPPLNEKNLYMNKYKEVYNIERKKILEEKARKDAIKDAQDLRPLLYKIFNIIPKTERRKILDEIIPKPVKEKKRHKQEVTEDQ